MVDLNGKDKIMLELRTYTRNEIAEILNMPLNNNQNEGIKRKLERYGVKFSVIGRGTAARFEIEDIADEFKLYCILDLNMSAGTDFRKFLYFMYYFFNDDDFRWLPDETLEIKMDENNCHISRQTISNYKSKLEELGLFHRSCDYVYYFARGQTQIKTDKETYNKSWREYWKNKEDGKDSRTAIGIMCANHGGVARKQAIIEENVIYSEQINAINDLVCNTIENELYKNENL